MTAAIKMGTNALAIPKKTAPDVLESMRALSEMGASRRRSKDRPFLSNVMVTESIDVVPKRIDIATTPGRIALISAVDPDEPILIKNIRVHANGKITPQLRLGGLR